MWSGGCSANYRSGTSCVLFSLPPHHFLASRRHERSTPNRRCLQFPFVKTASVIAICANAWHARDLSTCKPLGFDAETWIAALTALFGLSLFFGRKAARWLRTSRSKGHYIAGYIAGGIARSRFRNLCRALEPIMDENYRLFSRFGPNAGRGDGRPKTVRFELGVWYKLREKIAENNGKIHTLISENLSGIPLKYRATFTQWLDHIDAFQSHIEDPAADYREFQFPQEVLRIVKSYA